MTNPDNSLPGAIRLPHPIAHIAVGDDTEDVFTADQVREAILADRAADRANRVGAEPVAWQVKQKVYKDRGAWVEVDRTTYEAAAKYPDRCEVRALGVIKAAEPAPGADVAKMVAKRVVKAIEDAYNCTEQSVPRDFCGEATDAACSAVLDALGAAATQARGPGTPAYRFERLMDELEKRFPDPSPYSASPPEPRILALLDAALSQTRAAVGAEQGQGDAMAEAAIRALGIHVDGYSMDKVLKALAPFLSAQTPGEGWMPKNLPKPPATPTGAQS